MLNKSVIMGRITRDLELKFTPNNVAVCSFDIACERDFKSGGKKETDYISCVAWRNNAEFISKHFGKGRMIIIEGRLQVRAWQDKDGNSRKTVEVVVDQAYFADSKRPAENEMPEQQFGGFEEMPEQDDSEELPF